MTATYYPDPTTGRRIGHLGNFGLGYTLADIRGHNTYKLEIPLRLFDRTLRLGELPSMDVNESELTHLQRRNRVVQWYWTIFQTPISWMGRYTDHYIVSLPDNATDEQVDQFVQALQQEADSNNPTPTPVTVPTKWWQFWKRFGALA